MLALSVPGGLLHVEWEGGVRWDGMVTGEERRREGVLCCGRRDGWLAGQESWFLMMRGEMEVVFA